MNEIELGCSEVSQTLQCSEHETDPVRCWAQPQVVAYPEEALGSSQHSVEVGHVAGRAINERVEADERLTHQAFPRSAFSSHPYAMPAFELECMFRAVGAASAGVGVLHRFVAFLQRRLR